MPVQTTTSKFSLSKSITENAEKELKPRSEIRDLPGNIRGGVAKFKGGHFGFEKNDKTKPFVYLYGIVVKPKMAWDIEKALDEKGLVTLVKKEEVKVEGLRTSQMYRLYDQTYESGGVKKTRLASEEADRLFDQIRRIGGTKCLDHLKGKSEADAQKGVEKVLELLGADPKTFFAFATPKNDPSKKYPNPRMFENWYDRVDFVPQVDEEVVDRTGTSNGHVPVAEEAPAVGQEKGDEEATASTELAGDHELDELAETADSEPDESDEAALQAKEDAATKLQDMAVALGIDEDARSNAENWKALAELIGEAQGAAAPEESKAFEPVMKKVYKYRPVTKGPGGKPVKARKSIDHEVIKVYKKERTVDLKNLVDNKVTKGIAWDDLEQ